MGAPICNGLSPEFGLVDPRPLWWDFTLTQRKVSPTNNVGPISLQLQVHFQWHPSSVSPRCGLCGFKLQDGELSAASRRRSFLGDGRLDDRIRRLKQYARTVKVRGRQSGKISCACRGACQEKALGCHTECIKLQPSTSITDLLKVTNYGYDPPQARAFFETRGTQFTFCRCAKSFGDLYWTLWERGVPGIAEIKENGTAHSWEYRLENGTDPAAWVLVPDILGDHLSKEEAEIRIADSKKATLNNSIFNPANRLLRRNMR